LVNYVGMWQYRNASKAIFWLQDRRVRVKNSVNTVLLILLASYSQIMTILIRKKIQCRVGPGGVSELQPLEFIFEDVKVIELI
jgi:hypothetical protein